MASAVNVAYLSESHLSTWSAAHRGADLGVSRQNFGNVPCADIRSNVRRLIAGAAEEKRS